MVLLPVGFTPSTTPHSLFEGECLFYQPILAPLCGPVDKAMTYLALEAISTTTERKVAANTMVVAFDCN
jgi:hypothetical protein